METCLLRFDVNTTCKFDHARKGAAAIGLVADVELIQNVSLK